MALALNIKIIPEGNSADLLINGKHYVVSPATMSSLDDLRAMLGEHPGYVYDAVVAMLKEETEKV